MIFVDRGANEKDKKGLDFSNWAWKLRHHVVFVGGGSVSLMPNAVPWIAALLLMQSIEALLGQGAPAASVTIQTAPERPIIEIRDEEQFLNFDMIVRSEEKVPLRISQT